jgi:hypothetical protein
VIIGQGLLETICPECYLQNVVNKQDNIDKKMTDIKDYNVRVGKDLKLIFSST